MSKINLIPEIKQKKQRIQKINATVSSIATLTGIVLGALLLLILSYNGLLSTQIKSTNEKIVKTENSINTMKDLEEQVVILENGLKNIKDIISKNKSWTKFFSEIEKATPADIQFVSFSLNGNQVSADLRGSDIRSIDRFISSFSTYKNEAGGLLFSGVAVDSYNKRDNGQYSFQAKFNINEAEIWK